jgi:uncharacterized protein YlbG (UPF0298 family)
VTKRQSLVAYSRCRTSYKQTADARTAGDVRHYRNKRYRYLMKFAARATAT